MCVLIMFVRHSFDFMLFDMLITTRLVTQFSGGKLVLLKLGVKLC